MKNLSFWILLLSAFLIWGCQPENVAPEVESDAVTLRAPDGLGVDKDRPYKAVGYGCQVEAQHACDGLLPRAAEGYGTGTHLGRHDIVITECLDMNTGIALGSAVHTAANGDIVVVDYTMQYFPDSEDPDVIHGIFTNWTINGDESTGRFAGATGSGTGVLVGNLVENWMEWEVEGTINY